MVSGPTRFSIDEGFRQLAGMEGFSEIPQRQEFCDPLLVSFQEIPLSRLIDEELERFYNPSNGAVQMISRVFRRLTSS
jgi:hypothetical protein